MSQPALFPLRVVGREAVYTPDWLARAVVELLPWHGIETVLEPHVGGGAFVRAIEELEPGVFVRTMDADPGAPRTYSGAWPHQVGDFLTDVAYSGLIFDRVIGNPPFSDAEQHVLRALVLADEVAFLMPVSRMETPTRSAFYAEAPLRRLYLFSRRVWEGSRHIGLYWFDRGWRGDPELEFV